MSSPEAGPDANVADDAPLSQLSDAELASLCAERDAFYQSSGILADLKEYGCRAFGVATAAVMPRADDLEARAACKQGYDHCVAQPSSTERGPCVRPDSRCTAKAAALRACLADFPAAVAALVEATPSCDTLVLADLADASSPNIVPPDTCRTFEVACPGNRLGQTDVKTQ
jgi:hypothetical protein